MKTFISILVGGVLSVGAFAEAVTTPPAVAGNGNAVATPQVPFRPVQKRPTGTRLIAATAPKVNVAAPQFPFRPVQKRPTGTSSNKPSGTETASRQ